MEIWKGHEEGSQKHFDENKKNKSDSISHKLFFHGYSFPQINLFIDVDVENHKRTNIKKMSLNK